MIYTFDLSTLKKISCLCLFLIALINADFCQAQNVSPDKSSHPFLEWNFGVALIDGDFFFPGTSLLYGKSFINEKNFIVEIEGGIAIPSILTAKIGIGKKINETKFVMGVRPFPFNLYLQSSFTSKERGYWIISLEYNPIDDNKNISFGSDALLTFGYRWNK